MIFLQENVSNVKVILIAIFGLIICLFANFYFKEVEISKETKLGLSNIAEPEVLNKNIFSLQNIGKKEETVKSVLLHNNKIRLIHVPFPIDEKTTVKKTPSTFTKQDYLNFRKCSYQADQARRKRYLAHKAEYTYMKQGGVKAKMEKAQKKRELVFKKLYELRTMPQKQAQRSAFFRRQKEIREKSQQMHLLEEKRNLMQVNKGK